MQTARVNREEGGDDVKSSWPLHPGLHTYYNGAHKGERDREVEPIPKNASQCTHRPSHHESRFYPKPVSQPVMEASVYGRADDWGEVVTR